MRKLGIALLSVLAGISCAAKRHPAGVNILVPISCIREPVRLKGCNPRTLDHCQKAAVTYFPDCAMVELKPTHR